MKSATCVGLWLGYYQAVYRN